jgi:nucleotidyltransferase substrate binding protein (TIGR01987 family)
MPQENIRWIQRFENYKNALSQLSDAMLIQSERNLNPLEEQGLIQAFEYTHELAWKTMKDFILSRGNTEIYGPRDATRESFQLGLIENGEAWMDMIKSRNKSTHTYNKEIAGEIINLIVNSYYILFTSFQSKMNSLAEK